MNSDKPQTERATLDASPRQLNTETRAALDRLRAGAKCEVCHGPFGHASTAVPLGVTKPPRDLSDPAYQRATSDATLLERITSRDLTAGRP